MAAIDLKAPAKLNLFLLVTGKREDGYHFLFTLFHRISLWDRIKIEAVRGKGTIELSCSGLEVPCGDENLIHKAASVFLQNTSNDLDVFIGLEKNIPVGGGLGGGSSDAASVLMGLNEITGRPLNQDKLHELGESLGADVPFFLLDTTSAFGRGIGSELEAVRLPHMWFLLVRPNFGIETKWIYKNFKLTTQDEDTIFDAGHVFEPSKWRNDLEKVALLHYPEIGRIKNELLASGARTALMTGSGSTVYGFYENRDKAQYAYDHLAGLKNVTVYMAESL